MICQHWRRNGRACYHTDAPVPHPSVGPQGSKAKEATRMLTPRLGYKHGEAERRLREAKATVMEHQRRSDRDWKPNPRSKRKEQERTNRTAARKARDPPRQRSSPTPSPSLGLAQIAEQSTRARATHTVSWQTMSAAVTVIGGRVDTRRCPRYLTRQKRRQEPTAKESTSTNSPAWKTMCW